MGTGAKTKARRPRPAPEFISHRDLAAKLNVSIETLREWVAKGEWPEPHSILGATWMYKLSVYEHWRATGIFPEGVRFKLGEGQGRGAAD